MAESKIISSNFSEDSKGLEKLIKIAGSTVLSIENGMNKVVYGKPIPKDKKPKNPFDYGIMKLLDELAAINYCDLINYLQSQIKVPNKFDPKNPPDNEASFYKKQKWNVQKAAYDIQLIIDTYDPRNIQNIKSAKAYLDQTLKKKQILAINNGAPIDENGNPIRLDENGKPIQETEEQKKRRSVFQIIQGVKVKYEELKIQLAPELFVLSEVGADKDTLIKQFPQLKKIISTVDDKIKYISKFSDFRQLQNEDVDKILKILDKIKNYCILIQGLSSPLDVLNILSPKVNKQLQEQINKLQKIIDPARAIPTLRSLVKECQKINQMINRILVGVKSVQVLVKILVSVIKIFKILKRFNFALPIPNMVTTTGVTNAASDVVSEVITKKGTERLSARLSQINIVLEIFYNFCKSVSVIIKDMIARLNLILANLKNCDNVDPELIADLESQINNLQNSANQMDAFVAAKDNADNTTSRRKTSGEYIIQIITEEVIDENFRINRRYGIALDRRGILVVSSQPTYASDDNIIIAEVKQLLASKGLIKSENSIEYTLLEEELITEALSYLEDNDVNWELEDLGFSTELDDPNNEDESDGLGLNAFVNKLNGGKALRRRMRKSMIKNNLDLVSQLKQEDPQGKYSNTQVKKALAQNNKLKIDELKDEQKKLVALLALPTTPPTVKAITIKRLAEIKKEIQKLSISQELDKKSG